MNDLFCPDCGGNIYATAFGSDFIYIGCTACQNVWNRFGKLEEVMTWQD